MSRKSECRECGAWHIGKNTRTLGRLLGEDGLGL